MVYGGSSGGPQTSKIFSNVPDIFQQIVGLAREVGFDEVDDEDVSQLLESHGDDLTNEDLIQLEQQQTLGREQEGELPTPPTKQLTRKAMSEAFVSFKKAITTFDNIDPNTEISGLFKRMRE